MATSGQKPADANSGSTAAASAAAFLGEARDKIKANDNAGALISLHAVSSLAGCPPELRVEACKLLAQVGDSAGAIECYSQAGESYLTSKEFFKARQAFQAAHALDVHNLDVIFKLGQADVAEGRTQDGLAKFIDVLRKSNLKHVPALYEAGCIYQANGQFDQAMLAFKKVLDRDKTHVQACMHIGQLYQSKDIMQEAIGHYIRAAQIARECHHWGSALQIASMVLALDASNQKAKVILADLEEQGHGEDDAASKPVAAPSAAVPAAAAPATPTVAPPRASGTVPSVQARPPAVTPVTIAAAAQARPSQPAQPTQRPQPAQPASHNPAAAPSGAATERPLPPQMAARMTPPRVEPPAAPSEPAPPALSAAPPASPPAPQTSEAEIAHARQALAVLEAQRQAAQADLELLLSSRDELQQALGEQRALLETAAMRKQELESQTTAARSQTEQATQALESARAAQAAHSADAARSANEAAAAAAARAAKEKEALDAFAAQRRDLEAAVEKMKMEIAARQKDKAEAEKLLAEAAGKRDSLQAEVSALTAKMQDAKKLTDELEAMREASGKTQALTAQAKELESKVAEFESRRNQLEKTAGDAETAARERAAAALRAAEEAETQRDQRQAEATALEQRLETLRASLTELESRPAPPLAPPGAGVQANVGPQGAHARAAAHLAAGEYEKAIEAYRQSLEANPQDASAAYQAGALLAEGGGDLSIAEELLSRAAELRPEHAATRYQLAVVKARRGRVVDGVELLTTLVRTDSNNGEFIDQFIERLEKDASNGSIGARFKLGVAYRELGRVEEALVTLQAIQHETEWVVPCLIAIGLCLRRQGLDGAAAKRFAKAVETTGYAEPLYLEALYNLGDLYEAKGTQEALAQALSSFEEVYARDCTYRDVGDRVRVVKTNLGSAERAKVKRLPTRMADSQGNS